MIIPEIKLTKEEMCLAVHNFLITKGISLEVEEVDRNYSGKGAFNITLKEPEIKEEIQEAEPPEFRGDSDSQSHKVSDYPNKEDSKLSV